MDKLGLEVVIYQKNVEIVLNRTSKYNVNKYEKIIGIFKVQLLQRLQ